MNKAILIKEPKKVEITDLDMPSPGKDEVLLEILYGGVCGSDFKVYLGKMNNVEYPKIAGHEYSARVLETGEGAEAFAPGMIVTGTPYYGCGTCYCCRNGWFNCCQNNRTMGVGCDGAFRKYLVVPVNKLCDGRGLDPRTLALIEPFSNSLNLVKRLSVCPGETMLIFGAGPIGVFAMIAAKEQGAVVHLADTSKARLDFALDMGADGVLNVSEQDLADYVQRVTGDEGFNITVEAVGSGEVYKQCCQAVSFHGRVSVIGMTTQDFTYNHHAISFKELTIIGARNSNRQDFLDNIDSLVSGRLQTDYINRMITAEYGFSNASDMYRQLEDTYAENMKVLVNFAR